MYEETEAKADYAERPGTMDRFDKELARLDNTISELRKRIEPVIADRPEAETDEPRLAPSSQFANRVEQLGNLIDALRRISRDIDL